MVLQSWITTLLHGAIMNIWISNVSITRFAGVNTLWAAITKDGYIPERVHLLADEVVRQKGHLDQAIADVSTLIKGYGRPVESITHDIVEIEFMKLAEGLRNIVYDEKQTGNTVAIDMTPGRKYMSAFAMYMGVAKDLTHKADRIYYLHIQDLKQHRGKPFPLIPSSLMTLYDIKKELLEDST